MHFSQILKLSVLDLENFGQFNYNFESRRQIMAARGVYGTILIGPKSAAHFDNNNFSIIPKSIFSDNDNLLISCKNADLLAVDNFFDNIAHPYVRVM